MGPSSSRGGRSSDAWTRRPSRSRSRRPSPRRSPTPQGSLAPAAAERQPGGFPTTIDGAPVYVGIDALAHWHAATDDTSFLVGGWYDSHRLAGCSPPIGQYGLGPLEARLCARYVVDGLPGSPLYPAGFVMPDGDGPVVLRVHTRDPGAASCTPDGRAYCLERMVVESVAWFGDAGTVAAPIGPTIARSMATSVFVTEWRPMAGGEQMAVAEDIFTVPIMCPAGLTSETPWPTNLFSIHGDPRYGMVAVFPDTATREQFQAATDARIGPKCLDLVIERPAPPRWVGYENVLVLLFADDAFANRLADVMPNLTKPQKAISLTDPGFDRTLGTVTDYLVARSSGELDHAWGNRLIDTLGGDGYQAWYADVFRRHAAAALVGRIELLDETPTEARVGSKAWALLKQAGVTGSRIVRVTYDHATDPALATEDYLVVHMPASEIHDWQLIRIWAHHTSPDAWYGMCMFSERTQVLLSPEQLARLKRIAARDGKSVGAVIREAVDGFIFAEPDVRQRAVQEMLAMNAPVDDWEVMKAQIEQSQLGDW